MARGAEGKVGAIAKVVRVSVNALRSLLCVRCFLWFKTSMPPPIFNHGIFRTHGTHSAPDTVTLFATSHFKHVAKFAKNSDLASPVLRRWDSAEFLHPNSINPALIDIEPGNLLASSPWQETKRNLVAGFLASVPGFGLSHS